MLILSFLILQTGVTLRAFPAIWPFITYPMFSRSHYKGEIKNRYFVFGILEDSTVVQISHEDVNLDIKLFRQNFIQAMLQDRKELIKESLKLYQNQQTQKIVALRLENHPLVLSKDGYHPAPSEIISVIEF